MIYFHLFSVLRHSRLLVLWGMEIFLWFTTVSFTWHASEVNQLCHAQNITTCDAAATLRHMLCSA